MTALTRSLAATALGACVLGLTACGASTAAAPAAAAPTSATATPAATGTLDAVDQSGDGKSVKVAAVDIEAGGKGGWIALHKDLDGKPGPVAYFVAVPAGTSTNVAIPTPGGITTGAYWPMLHVDDHIIGTYEFPKTAGADLPAKADGMIVMKKITVTVP
jgi:hypothetical protein